ncbi:MAG TPA: hypothetical protein DGT23_09335 [Micromonosporaceae bacterium]|nr:hypothetical protein [Micromonosporaceae bacterium]
MKLKRVAVAFAALVVTGVTMVAGPIGSAAASPAAPAAAGCWHSGIHWWCKNSYGAPVYSLDWEGNYELVGRMYTTTSWFDCRSDDGPYIGGPHPYRWEFTRADNGAWGWMKDTSIISETNPLPICYPT